MNPLPLHSADAYDLLQMPQIHYVALPDLKFLSH